MKSVKRNNSLSGFSLIEVLVFVTILGLFFVAAISVITFSLKNMKINEHKILAVHYAEEGIEWIRNEKENDWETFVSKAGTHCLTDLTNWGASNDCGSSYAVGTPPFFRRVATLTNSGAQVDVKVIVYWIEGNQTMNVPIKTIVNLWE